MNLLLLILLYESRLAEGGTKRAPRVGVGDPIDRWQGFVHYSEGEVRRRRLMGIEWLSSLLRNGAGRHEVGRDDV